jgi:glycerol uptake facilitator-like aquaporin
MRLPRHLNPAITFAEFLHRHVGLIVALPYMGLQLAGSATAFVPLHGLGSSAIPNYATALRPVSYWVAVAVDLSLGTFVVYAYMQNASVADKLAGIPRHAEMSSKNRGFSSQAIVTGLAIFLSVFISYANGLYALANYVPYFGAAIDIGFTVPTSNAWTLPCVWFLVAGTVGYLLHFVTWNMNGLGNADFQAFVATTATEEEMLDAKASQWIACRIKSE